MKNFFKNGFYVIDLLYCTNIHNGEFWKDILYVLKFHSRKLRNILLNYDAFGIGLRISNFAVLDLNKFSYILELKKWLMCNNFYIKSLNGFPYGFFSSNYIKDDVYFPNWSNFNRYLYTRRLILFFSVILGKYNNGGISTVPISYKYFVYNFIYNNVYIKSVKYLCNLIILLFNVYFNKKILLHLDVEPEPDCVVSNTSDFIFFFKKWLISRCEIYLVLFFPFYKKNVIFSIFDYIKICFDFCHSAVQFETLKQSFNSIFIFDVNFGKFQISSALKLDLKFYNNINIFSYLPETPYVHQVIGNTFYGDIITYKDISLSFLFLYKKNFMEYRVHYHVPIFLEFYGIFESTQKYIIDIINFIKNKKGNFLFEIETYTFDILPCYLKLNVLYSLKREYEWLLKKL
ncbi:MAG: metabolite traffic protein EboE [Candidatus Azosocius agrarius]|nr:MAG: metabolite traffic protein EboE [Gammaproteobacteria bacterium]